MKPSLRAIIWTDWPALACLAGIFIMWLLYWLYPLINYRAAFDPDLIYTPIISSIILAALLLWRTTRIYTLFKNGLAYTDLITKVHLAKDRGRVEFKYQLDNKTFSSWTPVHKTKQVLALNPGQSVSILVSPTSPSKAIIKDLYLW